ncbi:hypothetical protein ES703_75073 [subsurface metagenome]
MSYGEKIEEARRYVQEYDRQRASVPSPGLVPGQYGYATKQVENRALNLTDADKSFLQFCRGAVLTPAESKALVQDDVGRYLVSPTIIVEIDRAIAEICIMRGLCGQKTIKSDRLQIRGIDEAQVGWGKLETGTDPTESSLTPTLPVYKYVYDLYGLSKVGEDELQDSDVNLAAILVDSFSRAVANAEELAFVAGLGHEAQQPEGFITNAILKAVTVKTTAAGAITLEKILEMIYTLPSKFRRKASFMFHSLTILELRKLRSKDQAGTYEGSFLWQPSVIAGQPPTLCGYPVFAQDDLGTIAGEAQVLGAFGDFKEGYRVLDHTSGLSIQRLVELYSEAGLVGFKIHKRCGGYVVRAATKPIVLLTEGTEA